MDAVMAGSFWRTALNQYRQQRRWAWGSENIPYVIYNFFKNKKILFKEKIRHAFVLLDGFWSSEPYFGFLNTFKYEEEKVTLDKYTIVGRTKTRRFYNWLQYFSVEGLNMEFRQAGLAIEEVCSDVTGKPYDAGALEFAVVANKAQE
jgi:hypothetical protein